MNKEQITKKTEIAIEDQLHKRGYATCIDCLVALGWLKQRDIEGWRKGSIDHLERVCCTSTAHLTTFLKAYQRYAKSRGYALRWTAYQHKKSKRPLLFSRHHDAMAEKRYAMHIVGMERKQLIEN